MSLISKMSDEKHIFDLWLKIDQLHLNFLNTGEKSVNLEGNHFKLHRRPIISILVLGLVVEYLSLVPQDRRFLSDTTGDIIANSAKYKPDFSLVEAEKAFRAIEEHATNLIRRPQK